MFANVLLSRSLLKKRKKKYLCERTAAAPGLCAFAWSCTRPAWGRSWGPGARCSAGWPCSAAPPAESLHPPPSGRRRWSPSPRIPTPARQRDEEPGGGKSCFIPQGTQEQERSVWHGSEREDVTGSDSRMPGRQPKQKVFNIYLKRWLDIHGVPKKW